MSYQDHGYDHGLPPTYQMATSVHYDNQKGANILLNGQYMQTNPNENTNYSVPFYVNPNQQTTVSGRSIRTINMCEDLYFI